MSSAPAGIIVIWNDIREDMRAEFHNWHSLEHIPERVAIPGFVRGQRWFGQDSAPQYLTTYLTADAAVLTSAAYLSRLNAPTPWTLRTVAAFVGTCRAAGTVAWQEDRSTGECGSILTARINQAVGDPAALVRAWSTGALQTLAGTDGVGCVRLVVTTAAASQLPTAERAVRSGDLDEPQLIVLAEGFGTLRQLRDGYDAATSGEPLLAQARVDLYSLQFGRSA
ncbi:MAG: hypothetical protein ACKVQQ_05965 [Burkholderiales bacterium]